MLLNIHKRGENMEKEKIWQIVCLVLVVIIIGLAVYAFGFKSNSIIKKSGDNSSENEFKDIRLDESISTDGKIENLDNVRWNNARITQSDGKLDVSLMINNESQDKKIGNQNLKVTLLDESGKEIASKDVSIKGIDANYGYKDINFSVEMKELVIVNDIKIVASKEENKEETKEEKDTETSEDLKNTNDNKKTKEAEKKEKN